MLAALGKREHESGRGTSPLDAGERAAVRRQAIRVVVESLVAGCALAGLAWWLVG